MAPTNRAARGDLITPAAFPRLPSRARCGDGDTGARGAAALLCALVATALLGASCVPYALPPVRFGTGMAYAPQREPPQLALLTVGAHTRGVVSSPYDAGIGLSVEGWQRDTRAYGPYLEVSRLVLDSDFVRASLGVRGELLLGSGSTGMGLHARFDAELFQHVDGDYSGSGNCGGAFGALNGDVAFGLYAEVGGQQLPDGRQAMISTVGFTWRIPAAYGVAIVIPGCH